MQPADRNNYFPITELEASMFGKKKKTEVFMTNHPDLYATVQHALKDGQIPFEVKVVNTGTRNRRTGTLIGRAGERPVLEIQYYIYTPREYAERARYVIDEYRKKLSR